MPIDHDDPLSAPSLARAAVRSVLAVAASNWVVSLITFLGGLYLVWKKAASHRIVVGCLAGYLVTQSILWATGLAGVASPLHGLMAGSVLFGIFFYATDPVSGPTTQPGRWIYGAFIGCMSALITTFSAWPAGTMFAILLANMFAPIMDHAIKATLAKKK